MTVSLGSEGPRPRPRPPSPNSPPSCADLYGRRRQLARVQFLEREIAILQDELNSLEDLQLASRCCKEVGEFIEARADPLLSIDQESSRSWYFWKRGKSCLKWICCFGWPICFASCSSGKSIKPGSCCLEKSGNRCCCHCEISSALCSWPSSCTKVKLCSKCARNCCIPCYY
ncbi:guanine nucleotide-binding protein subunit gamma 3-like [Diospyros lotus]|uniref:guanine nucleotide-binding protein subunit gamma 3-like n=1 Tax=Diospyros lotus TaxID=55363 RepID=UPI0022599E5C|nr:guanine nucleotide-binding protein subunit gamma 3-like [Diospyros lotus]